MGERDSMNIMKQPQEIRVFLQSIEYVLYKEFPKYRLEDMSIEQLQVELTGNFRYALKCFFAGSFESIKFKTKEQNTAEFTFPSTWLDMFKQKYFPEWLIKYFPINYTTVITKTNITHNYDVKVTKIYPELQPNQTYTFLEFQDDLRKYLTTRI